MTAALIVSAYVSFPKFREVCPDNERFLTWSQSVNDLNSPVMLGSKKKYAITGIGPGSFMYLFHAKNNQRNDAFVYAHNEYVQVLYESGILGAAFFAGIFLSLVKYSVKMRDVFTGKIPGLKRILLCSLTGISVCAAGCFVWQIGTHIFYTLTIVGLLYSDSLWKLDGGVTNG